MSRDVRVLIWPPVHKPEAVERLLAKNLPCLRPGCGCVSWWVL